MKSSQQTLSILGCGWTGRALAEAAKERYTVHCLGRNIAANEAAGYYDCGTLIVAIPPRSDSLQAMEHAYTRIPESTQVILLSSISAHEGNAAVLAAEELTRRLRPDAAILRLGGLMGYDRIAGKYTAGRTLADGMSRYIHRDDVVGILLAMIGQEIRNVTWDAIAPVQRMKSEIFAHNAEQFGFAPTRFETMQEEKKPLSPDALIEGLGYGFRYPDVMGFWG